MVTGTAGGAGRRLADRGEQHQGQPIPITLTLVPIVIGAVLYGPGAGALLGATFGLVTAVAGLTGYDAGTQALIQASPIWTILTCFVKATAAGWVAGLVYRALRKKQTLGCVLAAMSAPVVNTGIFLLAMTTVLRSSLEGVRPAVRTWYTMCLLC